MRVYLDIDGVLLDYGENPAHNAAELIDYLVNNHEVYWLTTHCRGDSIPTQIHLSRYFTDQPTLKNLAKIKPTNWDTWKTEAINFDEPFVWLDDDLFVAEQQELERRGAQYNVMLIDLHSNPDQLKRVIEDLKSGWKQSEPPKVNLDMDALK